MEQSAPALTAAGGWGTAYGAIGAAVLDAHDPRRETPLRRLVRHWRLVGVPWRRAADGRWGTPGYEELALLALVHLKPSALRVAAGETFRGALERTTDRVKKEVGRLRKDEERRARVAWTLETVGPLVARVRDRELAANLAEAVLKGRISITRAFLAELEAAVVADEGGPKGDS